VFDTVDFTNATGSIERTEQPQQRLRSRDRGQTNSPWFWRN